MSSDYGVKYTPANVETATPLANVSIKDLKSIGIKYIRVQWVDFVNNIRYRVISISYFAKLLGSHRPSISIAKCALGMVFGVAIAPGFSVMGEYLYLLDMSSIRLCSYAQGHASVMGWFEEKAPIIGLDGNLTLNVSLCPRSTLKRIVEDARKNAGVQFLVGFETEFILLKSTSPIQAVDGHAHGWSLSAALPSGSVEAKVLHEIAEALESSGVELQMYHAEATPGQYEVVTGPLPPLEAADALIHTRETIVNIASKYDLRATLAPRVDMHNCGSGMHTHLSVHSTANSSMNAGSATQGLSSHEASFLASLLDHIPALTGLTLPQRASYKRVGDGIFSGGTYVYWGTDNREAPVRLCNAPSPSARNFELRFVDGLANPYLALAGILGVGAVGVKDGKKLEVINSDGPVSAANMGEETRRTFGITKRMPLTKEESTREFASDELLRSVLGAELTDKYISINKALSEHMQADTEEATLTRLVEHY